ncbi:tail protein X [Acidovorax sp. IB03]|jgi:phage tail protein X|uniref:tail protein X n=1 Tax=Acidovorax sp. IB03 TaxID=2779366 RepID=UPI0018E786F7|nr:tail protein X [Acidovorax sp. IB03]MBJ2163020.1 tail protein X [Acidovorax sp. IB03]
MQVRTHQNDTVDQLCWRHLGKTERVVEATLELNPGLAAAGPILPAGMAITLPDHATMPAATRPTVNLWD